MDFKALECRIAPIKQTHYQIESLGNQCVRTRKKKGYEYYICDNCGERIILSNKKTSERTGGVMHVPISSCKELRLALCNKCAKPTIKKINEFYGKNF